MNPPRLAEFLIRLTLDDDDVSRSILGDLREEYAGDLASSHRRAAWRYWRQALGFPAARWLERFRRTFETLETFDPGQLNESPRRYTPAGDTMIQTLLQDLRYALRSFSRNPGFTAVALVILTLGIGATTAIFSVVDTVLLKSLPYEDPDGIVHVRHVHEERGLDGGGIFSPQDFEDLEDGVASYERLASYWFSTGQSTMNLVGVGAPTSLETAVVSEHFFSILGSRTVLGRAIEPADAEAGHDAVVVLSHAIWQSRFGADPGILGRTLNLDATPYEVIGVLPPSFRFPAPEAELFIPITRITDDMIPSRRDIRWRTVIGRLAPGVSPAAAADETRAFLARLAETHPDSNEGFTGAEVTPLREALVGGVRPALLVLLGATALVLLVACANLANLLLARGAGRGRELAVRMSLGASRRRLLRQLLTESLLLAVLGGVLGLSLSVWGVNILVAMSAGTLPYSGEIGPDLRVVLFAFAASLVTGVVFGLIPALSAASTSPAHALRDGRAAVGGSRAVLRGLLVVSETALAVMLVIGSGLMLKSFWTLMQVDPGFETERILTLTIAAPQDIIDPTDMRASSQRIFDYHQGMIEALEALPGMIAAGGSKNAPMGGSGEFWGLELRDQNGETRELRPDSGVQIVTAGYFEALGVTVIGGRTFDRADGRERMVVNQSLAEQYWPGENAVGKAVHSGDLQFEIIGVIADLHHEGLASETRSALYVLPSLAARMTMNLYLRTGSDPLAMAESVRQAIWAVNPNQPISNLGQLDRAIAADVAQPKFFTTLLAAFAGLALTLAALGIYGVVSYTVSQRTGELGVRMALGARGFDVIRLVLSQSMAVCLGGLVLGLLGAFWLARVLQSLLYGVEPRDPATFAGVAVLLVVVSMAASFVPALRATRVDPVTALRAE